MGKNGIQAIRGMRDILADQIGWWQRLERQVSEVLDRFGYQEIRTPILEQTSLFARSIGQETDIVSKEMYTFSDLDGSSLTLRPEGTASVVRAFVEHNLGRIEPVNRLYYLGPMFRHERPQKGRYRQFHQLGAELLGSADPAADVELIDVMVECVAAVGLTDTSLELNTLGCPSCRPAYRQDLVAYLSAHRARLCPQCQHRLETNPLRVLDCKEPGCVEVAEAAPRMLDQLCQDCAEHFGTVRAGLEGLGHDHKLNHRMVRGLDYYQRTAFELLAGGLGSQNAVAGGGRYDGLVAQLGGTDTPGVGFAAGLDRILLSLAALLAPPEQAPVVFLASLSDAGWQRGLSLAQQLRRAGHKVLSDVRRGSLKSQMKRADKDHARFVLILGEEELDRGTVTVKDMAADIDEAAKQVLLPQEELIAWLSKRLEHGAALGRCPGQSASPRGE